MPEAGPLPKRDGVPASPAAGGGGRALILLYHRVADTRPDPFALCVAPHRFAEQMQVLRERATPVPLARLQAVLESNRPPPRPVAVTFDDGYADNLEQAWPVLDRNGVPATIFVVAGSLDEDREFWWDELERVLLPPGRLPAELELTIGTRTWRWQLGPSSCLGEAEAHEHAHWYAWEPGAHARHDMYWQIWQLLHPLGEDERQRVIDDLLQWSGVEAGARRSHRRASMAELRVLHAHPLVEIGAHTVTHVSLAGIPLDSQAREIHGSKRCLEDALGGPVESFSYPFGRARDITAATVAQVRDAGFRRACLGERGPVMHDTDPFRLPRAHVADQDGDTFAAWLETLFHARS